MKIFKKFKDLTTEEKIVLAATGLLVVVGVGELVVIHSLNNERDRLIQQRRELINMNYVLKTSNDILTGNNPEFNNNMNHFVDELIDCIYSRNVDKLGLNATDAKFYTGEDVDDYLFKHVNNYKSLSGDDALDLHKQICELLDKKGFKIID